MLFQPVERRERKSINLVTNFDMCNFEKRLGIYATKGDSDQDVFVNLEYETLII